MAYVHLGWSPVTFWAAHPIEFLDALAELQRFHGGGASASPPVDPEAFKAKYAAQLAWDGTGTPPPLPPHS